MIEKGRLFGYHHQLKHVSAQLHFTSLYQRWPSYIPANTLSLGTCAIRCTARNENRRWVWECSFHANKHEPSFDCTPDAANLILITNNQPLYKHLLFDTNSSFLHAFCASSLDIPFCLEIGPVCLSTANHRRPVPEHQSRCGKHQSSSWAPQSPQWSCRWLSTQYRTPVKVRIKSEKREQNVVVVVDSCVAFQQR